MIQNKLNEYIEKGWRDTLRYHPEDTNMGDHILYGLPYPFTVPAKGHFEELYYWDTYFANKGLELCDEWLQVKNNTDDVLFMIERFGAMKNSSRSYHAGQLQPPFSSIMVRDVYEHYRDNTWLYGAYNTLKKEYDFWMTNRITPIGLNQYGGEDLHRITEAQTATNFCNRISGRPDGYTDSQLAEQNRICCESGWDMSPRWGFDGVEFVQIDLNSLLFAFEKNMAYFSRVLGIEETEQWLEKACCRKALMDKYMLTDKGYYTDYNFVKNTHSDIFSVASFFPMYLNVCDKQSAQNTMESLHLLEADYGITACQDNDYVKQYTMQWNYPVGWGCLHHVIVKALDNYGYTDKAKEICQKYINLLETVFEKTGQLWEKYNVVEGSNNVLSHGRTTEMPPMMGWTAGAYLTLKNYIEKGKIN